MKKLAVLLDTSFIIALNNVKDANYKNAQAIKILLKNKESGQSYISDYIFDELVTFLLAKSFPIRSIHEIGDALLAEESITFLKVDAEIFQKAWDLFKKFNALSFTDCTSIILAQEYNIKNIASFDADFDRMSFLRRLC